MKDPRQARSGEEAAHDRFAAVARRPLLGLALTFAVGIGLGFALPLRLELPALLLPLLLLGAWRGRTRWFANLCLLAAGLTLGWLRVAIGPEATAARILDRLMVRPQETLAVRGVVADDPVTEPLGKSGHVRHSFTLRLLEIDRAGHWLPMRGAVQCAWNTSSNAPPPAYGQQWLFGGVLCDPRRSDTEDGRGGSAWRLRITAEMNCRLEDENRGNPLYAFCIRLRHRAFDLLGRGLERLPEHAAFLRAMMTGTRSELDAERTRDFSITGTTHIIAISGSHVVVILGILLVVLQGLGIPRPRWFWFLAPLLVVYTLMAGAPASAVRACVMALFMWLAVTLYRRPDGLTVLGVTALAMLAAAPEQLRDLGFLLSFACVAGLMVFCGPLTHWLSRFAPEEPWRIQAASWPRRVFEWLARQTVMLLAASLAAWLASTPLTAQYFNLFSPVALVANLVIVPLSSIVILLGGLTLFIGAPFPALAAALNQTNGFVIGALFQSVDLCANVPGGHWFMPAPGWWAVGAWYAFFLLWRFGGRMTRLGLAALALAVCGWGWHSVQNRGLQVVVPGPALGPACLFRLPHAPPVLIDPGPVRQYDRLRRFLQQQGVNRIGALVLSAPYAERAGAASQLMKDFPVRELWIPGTLAERTAEPLAHVLAEARQRGVAIRPLRGGQQVAMADGVRWQALHPPPGFRGRRAGDHALVLRLECRGLTVLTAPYLTPRLEQTTLAAGERLRAQLLLAGNAPEPGVLSAVWLAAVRPDAAILIGEGGGHGAQPRTDTLRRLQAGARTAIVLAEDSPAHTAQARRDGQGFDVRELDER